MAKKPETPSDQTSLELWQIVLGIMLVVIAVFFVAAAHTPDQLVPHYANPASEYGNPFVVFWQSIRIYVYGAGFLGIVGVTLYLYLTFFKSNGLTELIEKHCPRGPYSVAPASIIPPDTFLAWKDKHRDAFNQPPEDAKLKDYRIHDWAKLLTSGSQRRALLEPRPFLFRDSVRFAHQFIVGGTSSGKTTYLSNQIRQDLERVAKDECCVFVMDSKQKLIPSIARLKLFAKDGPLDGKLLYIEPTPELALNIFDLDSDASARRLRNEAMQMITFFLGSVVHLDASGHQEALLTYLIPAVLACPDPTIYTMLDMTTERGYASLRTHFAHLRQVDYLDELFVPTKNKRGNSGMSIEALRTRLRAIVGSDEFHDLFSRPKSSLHIYDELQKPQVILVNTMKTTIRELSKQEERSPSYWKVLGFTLAGAWLCTTFLVMGMQYLGYQTVRMHGMTFTMDKTKLSMTVLDFVLPFRFVKETSPVKASNTVSPDKFQSTSGASHTVSPGPNSVSYPTMPSDVSVPSNTKK